MWIMVAWRVWKIPETRDLKVLTVEWRSLLLFVFSFLLKLIEAHDTPCIQVVKMKRQANHCLRQFIPIHYISALPFIFNCQCAAMKDHYWSSTGLFAKSELVHLADLRALALTCVGLFLPQKRATASWHHGFAAFYVFLRLAVNRFLSWTFFCF